MARVVQNAQSMQYTGVNGTTIASFVPNTPIVSDDGVTIVFDEGDNGIRGASVGDWIISYNSGGTVGDILSPSRYSAIWWELP